MAVDLDQDIRARVVQLAESRHRTAHWVMREAFRQDTLKAWEEYQETGLHANAAYFESWLASWGAENKAPTPGCHK